MLERLVSKWIKSERKMTESKTSKVSASKINLTGDKSENVKVVVRCSL